MNGPFYLSYFFYIEDFSKDLNKSFDVESSSLELELISQFSIVDQQKLASLFLARLKHQIFINEAEILPLIEFLENISLEPVQQCRFAELLFFIGLKRDDSVFLIKAKEVFEDSAVRHVSFFNDPYGKFWTLFGHLMLYIGEATSDLNYVFQSIEKYDQAILLLQNTLEKAKNDPYKALSQDYLNGKNSLEKLYMYKGFSWALLSKYSEEPYDIIQSVSSYEKAIDLGCLDNSFWIHYGRALVLLGESLNRIEYFQKGLEVFKKVIANSYTPLEISVLTTEEDQDPSLLYLKNHLTLSDPFTEVWLQAALTAKKIYEHTHLRKDFLDAHDIFEKASQAIADKNHSLWLYWGDLFLKASYYMGKLPFAEIALEKFTSPKIKDSDHLLVTCAITESLILIGSLLENYKIIRESDKRALPLLQGAKNYPDAWVTNGLSQLSLGSYLSDDKYLFRALDYFSKSIELDIQSVGGWHGAFLTYMALAEQKQDKSYFLKAQGALNHVLELKPLGAYFWYEYGLLFFKLRDFEDDLDLTIKILEDSLEKFEIAINLTGGFEETLESGWLYPYGCALFLLGDLLGEEAYYKKSLEVLLKLYRDEENFPYIHFQLGVNYLRLGEISGERDYLFIGIDHLEKNLEFDPEDSPGLGELGYAYLVISEWTDHLLYPELEREWKEKAERLLLHAAKVGYEDAYYHLACLYSLMNRLDLSLIFIKRAEKSGLISTYNDLFYDDWLDNLRKSELFQAFLEQQNELDHPFF